MPDDRAGCATPLSTTTPWRREARGDLGRARRQSAAHGGNNDLLPGPTRGLGPSEHGGRRRADATALRPSGDRRRSGLCHRCRHRTGPHRGIQALAGGPSGQERQRECPLSRSGTASAPCGPSSSASWNGSTTTLRPACSSTRATSLPSTSPCPSSWTTPRRRSSWPLWRSIRTCAVASWSSCWPAPACVSASSAVSKTTPWCATTESRSPQHPRRQAPQRPLRAAVADAGRPHRRLQGPPRTVALGTPARTRRRRSLRPAHRAPLRAAVAKRAGVGPVHPHQLRHTLATQSINRGMSAGFARP